jgi:hypothetical protein
MEKQAKELKRLFSTVTKMVKKPTLRPAAIPTKPRKGT